LAATPLSYIWFNYCQGHDAVTLFLLLSGFSLMMPIARTADFSLSDGFFGFFRRRFIRIVPTYYAAIVVILVSIYTSHLFKSKLGLIDNTDDWAINFQPSIILTHLLLIHNLFENQYLAISGQLWSIGLEWQVYFVFILLLLPIWRYLHRVLSPAQAFIGLFIVSTALGTAFLLLPAAINLKWTSPWYIVVFAIGMIGGIIAANKEPAIQNLTRRFRWDWFALFFFLWQFVGRATGVFPRSLNPAKDILYALAGMGLLLMFAKHIEGPTNDPLEGERAVTFADRVSALLIRPFVSRAFVFVGAFSYSLYLTHAIFTERVYVFLERRPISPLAYGFLYWFGGITGSLILAWCFYAVVERPCLKKLRQMR
jgi:peptidoglycan/LPS O-acetylase OafA/YrhL